jgi:Domain of unknown function (DUF4271)
MQVFRLLLVVALLPFSLDHEGTELYNLKNDWLIYNKGRYQPYSGERVTTIFFTIKPAQFKFAFLTVADHRKFYLFIGKKLVVRKNKEPLRISLDSLASIYPAEVSISIFQPAGIKEISTVIRSARPQAPPESDPLLRRGNYFLDFSLSAALLLACYFVFLIRTNPRLLADYFRINRLFSIQERDENVLAGKLTSRFNILFYTFCSFLCALTLLVVFHYAGNLIPAGGGFLIRSTGEGFLQWVTLTMVVAGILNLKMLLVYLFSVLFSIREIMVVQYFNFIRGMFLATLIIIVGGTMNFMFKGSDGGFYVVLLQSAAGLLVLSGAITFLKIGSITRFHFFHLFSYFCASEIIPLVILLKILLY